MVDKKAMGDKSEDKSVIGKVEPEPESEPEPEPEPVIPDITPVA